MTVISSIVVGAPSPAGCAVDAPIEQSASAPASAAKRETEWRDGRQADPSVLERIVAMRLRVGFSMVDLSV